MFAHLIPNDAHEYYTFLLDTIQKITHIPIYNDTSAVDISAEEREWAASFKNDWSKIVPLLYGQIRRTLCCETCKSESNTYEVFNHLKTDLIGENIPLIDSINAIFKEEDIEGYQCDTCKGKTNAKISQSIIKSPPYLCICINRFVYGFGSNKDRRGFTLDNDRIALNCGEYELMSTIDHHGSMHGGHYIAQIKHMPACREGPKTDQWYLYDDENVHELSKCHLSASTYMLFFRRVDITK
jgi:ubiquitin C-terminal hydrolase